MLHFPSVLIVDPDTRIASICRRHLAPNELSIFSFQSPRDFFSRATKTKLGCIVSELQFPDESGIDFCQQLRREGWSLPILIHTAFGDVTSCSEAFRAGVSDFLEKNIPPDLLIERVLQILERSKKEHMLWLSRVALASRLSRLTDRERDVVHALVSGQSMKEIASQFGTSFQAVSRHRQRILLKLQVDNDVALANLIRDWSPQDAERLDEFSHYLSTTHD